MLNQENLEALTAEAILAIPEGEPERLFSPPAEAKLRHRKLALLWHPDSNPTPTAGKVLAHVNRLYDLAVEKIEAGVWQEPGLRKVRARDGKTFALKYRKARTFELGEVLLSQTLITFLIDKKHEDLVLKGLRMIGSVRYPDNKMKAEIEKYIPKVQKFVETEHQFVVAISKTPDLLLADDLLAHLGGQLPPRHVAWVVSSLLNILCFLELTGRTHNGLTTNSILISPKWHSVCPFGGWWYAAKVGETMLALPPAVHAVTPGSILLSKAASHRTDLEALRAIGRVCLGDPSGTGLQARKDVPKALADWMRLPAPSSPLKDYENWQSVLTDSFGPRRFVELLVNPDAVYPGV